MLSTGHHRCYGMREVACLWFAFSKPMSVKLRSRSFQEGRLEISYGQAKLNEQLLLWSENALQKMAQPQSRREQQSDVKSHDRSVLY